MWQKMTKRAGFLALGGHVGTQNLSFRTIMEMLPDWNFYGLENGFRAFDTGVLYPLEPGFLDPNFAGFYAGATRSSLTDKKTGKPIKEKIDQAIRFVRAANLNYLIASCGDDHGHQMDILREALEGEGIDCKVLVITKTMDGDKGGEDGTSEGEYVAPYADTTNGFHTAITTGLEQLKNSYAGAWTNEGVTIFSHFGRDTNWVNAVLAWYGNADLAVYGELPENESHSLDNIAELASKAMENNHSQYGRSFATLVVSEGTRIEGIHHVLDNHDPHGHHELSPSILGQKLKDELRERDLKPQLYVVTYEMRNHPPSPEDMKYARITAEKIVEAMNDGVTGYEAVLKFKEGEVVSELVPIHLASQKRLVRHYPGKFYDSDTLSPLQEIETYFKPMFGERAPLDLWLPKRPKIVSVYKGK